MLAARPVSVGALLVRRVEKSPSKEAFRYLEDDRWVSLSWLQTKDKVFQLAAGLLALGIKPEDRVAIASNTRMEWILGGPCDHVRGRRDDNDLPVNTA